MTLLAKTTSAMYSSQNSHVKSSSISSTTSYSSSASSSSSSTSNHLAALSSSSSPSASSLSPTSTPTQATFSVSRTHLHPDYTNANTMIPYNNPAYSTAPALALASSPGFVSPGFISSAGFVVKPTTMAGAAVQPLASASTSGTTSRNTLTMLSSLPVLPLAPVPMPMDVDETGAGVSSVRSRASTPATSGSVRKEFEFVEGSSTSSGNADEKRRDDVGKGNASGSNVGGRRSGSAGSTGGGSTKQRKPVGLSFNLQTLPKPRGLWKVRGSSNSNTPSTKAATPSSSTLSGILSAQGRLPTSPGGTIIGNGNGNGSDGGGSAGSGRTARSTSTTTRSGSNGLSGSKTKMTRKEETAQEKERARSTIVALTGEYDWHSETQMRYPGIGPYGYEYEKERGVVAGAGAGRKERVKDGKRREEKEKRTSLKRKRSAARRKNGMEDVTENGCCRICCSLCRGGGDVDMQEDNDDEDVYEFAFEDCTSSSSASNSDAELEFEGSARKKRKITRRSATTTRSRRSSSSTSSCSSLSESHSSSSSSSRSSSNSCSSDSDSEVSVLTTPGLSSYSSSSSVATDEVSSSTLGLGFEQGIAPFTPGIGANINGMLALPSTLTSIMTTTSPGTTFLTTSPGVGEYKVNEQGINFENVESPVLRVVSSTSSNSTENTKAERRDNTEGRKADMLGLGSWRWSDEVKQEKEEVPGEGDYFSFQHHDPSASSTAKTNGRKTKRKQDRRGHVRKLSRGDDSAPGATSATQPQEHVRHCQHTSGHHHRHHGQQEQERHSRSKYTHANKQYHHHLHHYEAASGSESGIIIVGQAQDQDRVYVNDKAFEDGDNVYSSHVARDKRAGSEPRLRLVPDEDFNLAKEGRRNHHRDHRHRHLRQRKKSSLSSDSESESEASSDTHTHAHGRIHTSRKVSSTSAFSTSTNTSTSTAATIVTRSKLMDTSSVSSAGRLSASISKSGASGSGSGLGRPRGGVGVGESSALFVGDDKDGKERGEKETTKETQSQVKRPLGLAAARRMNSYTGKGSSSSNACVTSSTTQKSTSSLETLPPTSPSSSIIKQSIPEIVPSDVEEEEDGENQEELDSEDEKAIAAAQAQAAAVKALEEAEEAAEKEQENARKSKTTIDLEDWEDLKELYERGAEMYENSPPQQTLPLLRGVIHECHRFMLIYPDPSVLYSTPQSLGFVTPILTPPPPPAQPQHQRLGGVASAGVGVDTGVHAMTGMKTDKDREQSVTTEVKKEKRPSVSRTSSAGEKRLVRDWLENDSPDSNENDDDVDIPDAESAVSTTTNVKMLSPSRVPVGDGTPDDDSMDRGLTPTPASVHVLVNKEKSSHHKHGHGHRKRARQHEPSSSILSAEAAMVEDKAEVVQIKVEAQTQTQPGDTQTPQQHQPRHHNHNHSHRHHHHHHHLQQTQQPQDQHMTSPVVQTTYDLPTAFYTLLGSTLFFFGCLLDANPHLAMPGEPARGMPYWLAALDVFEIGENLPVRTRGVVPGHIKKSNASFNPAKTAELPGSSGGYRYGGHHSRHHAGATGSAGTAAGLVKTLSLSASSLTLSSSPTPPVVREDWKMAIMWGRTLVCVAEEVVRREREARKKREAEGDSVDDEKKSDDDDENEWNKYTSVFPTPILPKGAKGKGKQEDEEEDPDEPVWPPNSPFAAIAARRPPLRGRVSLKDGGEAASPHALLVLAQDQFSRGILHMPHPIKAGHGGESSTQKQKGGKEGSATRMRLGGAGELGVREGSATAMDPFLFTPELGPSLNYDGKGPGAHHQRHHHGKHGHSSSSFASGTTPTLPPPPPPPSSFSRAKELYTIAYEVLLLSEKLESAESRQTWANYADSVFSQMKMEVDGIPEGWWWRGHITAARGRCAVVIGSAIAEEVEERLERAEDDMGEETEEAILNGEEAREAREVLAEAVGYLTRAKEEFESRNSEHQPKSSSKDRDADTQNAPSSSSAPPAPSSEEIDELKSLLAEALLSLANLTKDEKEREALYARAKKEGGEKVDLDEMDCEEDEDEDEAMDED